MNHFLSMKDLSEHELLRLIKESEELKETGIEPINRKLFAANLFFEPSTRTKMSFTIAQRRLGLESLDFNSDTSSVQKGETIYDTARTFEALGASVLVIRQSEEEILQPLADGLSIPVINAGDGKGEHPSQSLLDLLTIYQEYKKFTGLNVAIIGDIKHSRVARSNAYALSTLGANVYLSSKPEWQDSTLRFPYISIDEAVDKCDVVMLLRVQHERHQENDIINKTEYLDSYGLTIDREKRMKEHAIILHPAPVNRGVEIADSLVESGKSRIFKQMENGVYARMAIIKTLLENRGIIDAEIIGERTALVGR
ncbi:aspartate carbamoyltransferase catalytic subunit [Sediminibacillus massiliensis]|uniref:aspartate carbamoyltransferase catalytic subunit n=1 Tax=Sediminibacillus massiliensis TaxID=1926277 RepID=UPI0009883E81|nr:aspartate carbamoyltransferase catalytic subunit [Sediminibacillus massiliensis]